MEPSSYFDEFFASGREEVISPFLTPDSRKWAKNLSLRVSLLSALFLSVAFIVHWINLPLSHLLLVIVYFLSGTPALINALHVLRRGIVNIDVLMTLAALLSVLIGSGFEGGLLLVLFETSGAMEEAVTKKARTILLHLNQLSPRTCYSVQGDGSLHEKAVRDVVVGEEILVKAGEVVPLDGVVSHGSSFVNLVHLTGESLPAPKKTGDEVPAGAGNLDGSLTLKVLRTSSDSTISRIIKLITQAQEAKPKIQQFLDKFGRAYATAIMVFSFLSVFALHLIFSVPFLGTEGAIYRSLTFLIAASPCALIIAVPTAYLSAISSCAKKGILLKGGIALDGLSRCKTIAFDKTGTLTTGKLTCIEVKHLLGPELSLSLVVQLVSSLERHSSHPIAESILKHAQLLDLKPIHVDHFNSVAGFGIEGVVSQKQIYVGHEQFIRSKLSSSVQLPIAEHLSTYAFIDSSLYVFYFTDELRPQAQNTLVDLREKDLRLLMLSGDHHINAEKVARQLGISEYFSDLRPEDKLKKVEELSSKQDLAMVGDGINDAPALARATIGISMGKIGSATAIDASDIVILNDDLSLLSWLYTKARRTMRIVYQNFTLALIVIICATTPSLLGYIPLWLAVILHEGGTVLVGLNSLRLLNTKYQK